MCVDFTDKSIEDHREYPVPHVIRLPQLCRDEELSGGSGLLREDNIAQVYHQITMSELLSCSLTLQGLAERLQLMSHSTHLVHYRCGLSHGLYSKEMAMESSPLDYLAHSYARAIREKTESPLSGLIQKCKDLIGEMAGLVIDVM